MGHKRTQVLGRVAFLVVVGRGPGGLGTGQQAGGSSCGDLRAGGGKAEGCRTRGCLLTFPVWLAKSPP